MSEPLPAGADDESHEESGVLRTKLRKGGRPGAALALCGAVLLLPLLLIRNDPAASASPDPHITDRPHTRAGPEPSRPASSERPALRPRHSAASSRPSAPAAAATVAYDTTVTGTVPGTAPARATNRVGGSAYSSPLPQSASDPAPAAEAAPPQSASAAPVTTTTLAPPRETGEGVVTHGIVTYYAHPAGRCASPWIPFGTTVWITNPENGRSVSCVVDDYETDTSRSVDLATASFAEIAPLSQGVVDAELSW